MTRFAGCVRALFIVVLMVAPAFSQSRNTGEIRGTVSAGGAVLPGATVTVTNIDTGEKKDFVTNQDGIYDTVSTPTGNYSISFAAQGSGQIPVMWAVIVVIGLLGVVLNLLLVVAERQVLTWQQPAYGGS